MENATTVEKKVRLIEAFVEIKIENSIKYIAKDYDMSCDFIQILLTIQKLILKRNQEKDRKRSKIIDKTLILRKQSWKRINKY